MKTTLRWLLGFTLLVLVLTTLPYVLAYQRQGELWRFSGFLFGADDGNSYIAKMLRGASGDWLFRTPYTAFPQSGILAFLPYLLLGKLSAPPAQHEQLVAFFQLFRWLAVVLMAAGTYAFLGQYLSARSLRRAGLAFALLGGGLGWVSVAGAGWLWSDRLPLEFYSPESFGFLSVLGLPHLAAARGLLLLGMAFFLRSITAGRLQDAAVAGLLWLVMGFFQPLSIATTWAVLGVAFVLNALVQIYRRRSGRITGEYWVRPLFTAGVISAPLLLYNLWISLSDPFVRLWSRQNIILSPPPGDYLLAYAPFLLLAVPGLVALYRQDERTALLLLAWIAAFPFLAYAPHPIQRRLPEGIWVVLVTAALAGYDRLRGKWRPLVRSLSLTAFFPALILLVGAFASVWKPAAPLYLPVDQAAANQFLAAHAARDSVVLADFNLSNSIPAWAPVRTITGHGPESVQAEMIRPAVQRFFDPQTPASARADLLRRYNVTFVLTGPQDAWQPSGLNYLAEVFARGNYHVFQIEPPLP